MRGWSGSARRVQQQNKEMKHSYHISLIIKEGKGEVQLSS